MVHIKTSNRNFITGTHKNHFGNNSINHNLFCRHGLNKFVRTLLWIHNSLAVMHREIQRKCLCLEEHFLFKIYLQNISNYVLKLETGGVLKQVGFFLKQSFVKSFKTRKGTVKHLAPWFRQLFPGRGHSQLCATVAQHNSYLSWWNTNGFDIAFPW